MIYTIISYYRSDGGKPTVLFTDDDTEMLSFVIKQTKLGMEVSVYAFDPETDVFPSLMTGEMLHE